MAEDIFEVKRERFDLLRPEIYLLQGTWPEGYRVEAYLKKQKSNLTKTAFSKSGSDSQKKRCSF